MAQEKRLPHPSIRRLTVSSRKKVEKKLLRREKRYETERLMREKRSEEYQVIEEVFDRSTLMTLYDFLNQGTIAEIRGAVKAGKESKIYWGLGSDESELAIKIYLTVSSEFKKGMLLYIEGDQRFAHVKRDTRSLVYVWAQKEFKNLKRAYEAGVPVPKPIAVSKNLLVMNFVGKNGVPAPLLKAVSLAKPERTYRQLITSIRKLYQKAELVHADLSEYNIMIWKGKPVLFDVSQAVLLNHPMAQQFLRRDLENLTHYFERLGVKVQPMDELHKTVTGGKG
jgi:RIO kinase 1